MTQYANLGSGIYTSPTIYKADMVDITPIGFILDPNCKAGPQSPPQRMNASGGSLMYYSQYAPCTGCQRCQQTYTSPCSQALISRSTCGKSNQEGYQFYDIAYHK